MLEASQKQYPSFEERVELFRNPVAQKLCRIAGKKQSRLVLSADVTSAAELLRLADQLGPYITVLKTHMDIISDFSYPLIDKLKSLSMQHDFLLFEDRKFADIGQTVIEQCQRGIYHIAEWADMINAHIISGPGIIPALAQACERREVMLLLISELSARGALTHQAHQQAALQFACGYKDFVSGFIAQQRHDNEQAKQFLYFSPGVHLDLKQDQRDQQYRSPAYAVTEQGIDFIIVGRGITAASDPVQAAMRYLTFIPNSGYLYF